MARALRRSKMKNYLELEGGGAEIDEGDLEPEDQNDPNFISESHQDNYDEEFKIEKDEEVSVSKARGPKQNINKNKFYISKEKSIMKAEQLPRVGGVCFDKNRQRWIAHWKICGKYVKNYFPVSNYGFEEARRLAVKCRQDAEEKYKLPAIQLRHDKRSKKSRPMTLQEKQLTQKAAETFFDASENVWVTIYSYYEKFPVDLYGFAEAKKKAFNCRKQHEIPIEIKHSKGGESYSVKEENKIEEEASEPPLKITQEAIQIIINDLKDTCLPNLKDYFEAENDFLVYNENLEYHNKGLRYAKDLDQLQPYLYLFQDCILNHLLPSNKTLVSQIELIKELYKMSNK